MRKFCLVPFLMITAGCNVYTMESLQPEPDPMEERLLPLMVGFNHGAPPNQVSPSAVTYESDLATVFRRELEANVFGDDVDRYGFAELRMVWERNMPTASGGLLMALNALTLGVPALFGIPYSIRERTMQVEIILYDASGVEVTKYPYVRKHRITENVYYPGRSKLSAVLLLKEIMQQFRQDLAHDLDRINQRLMEVGPVGQKGGERDLVEIR